jgi:RNA polymerase sigma factor (sigma-70 family)
MRSIIIFYLGQVTRVSQSRFDTVFLQHRLSLLRTLKRMVHNASVAEELLHDTWLRVTKALAERPIEHLEPFVFQTARNLALDHLRAQQRYGISLDTRPLEDLDQVPAPGSSAEGVTHAQRVLERVNASLACLSTRQRAIFLRSRVQGQPCPTIAKALGVSTSTVQKELKFVMQKCIEAVGDPLR